MICVCVCEYETIFGYCEFFVHVFIVLYHYVCAHEVYRDEILWNLYCVFKQENGKCPR